MVQYPKSTCMYVHTVLLRYLILNANFLKRKKYSTRLRNLNLAIVSSETKILINYSLKYWDDC
jgi:hypothetical protein